MPDGSFYTKIISEKLAMKKDEFLKHISSIGKNTIDRLLIMKIALQTMLHKTLQGRVSRSRYIFYKDPSQTEDISVAVP